MASFFLAFLLTSNFSRSKIKRAWPISNHLDFTFGQRPLFLFFHPLPPFLSFFLLAALSQKRIDLPSMLGVYVVMGCGITAAFITLIAEIFWKKMMKKRESTPSCLKRYKVIVIKVRPTGKSSFLVYSFFFFFFFECFTFFNFLVICLVKYSF